MNEADGLGFVLAMGWVLVLMAATILSASVQRKNERKQYAQVGATKMYGIGLEIEAIRQAHAEHAPNQKIAHWLNLHKAKDAPGAFKRFLSFVQAQNAKARRTRAARRAYLRSVEQPTEKTDHTHESSDWMQGRTTGGITRVTTDGSLSSGGFEVVSPPLAPAEVTAWILETVEPLRTIARINRTTGLHAHVALRKPNESFDEDGVMSSTEAKSIGGRTAYAWSFFFHDLKKIFPSSRWDNQYAQAHNLHDPDMHPSDMAFTATSHTRRTYNHETDMYEATEHTGDTHYHYLFDWHSGHGRYQHLNLKSMFSRGFGTLEFRAHQGTVNPMKISRWVEFCTRFVAACEDETNYLGFFSLDDLPNTREAMWAFMDLEPDHHLRDYYEKRAVVLHGIPTTACVLCGSTHCVHGECEVFIDRASALQAFNDLENQDSLDLRNTYIHCHDEDCGSSMSGRTYTDRFSTSYLRDFLGEHDEGDYIVTPRDGVEMECPYCGETELVMGTHRYTSRYEMGALPVFMLGLMVTAPLVGAVALLVGCGIGLIHSGSVKGNNAKKASTRLFSGLSSRGNQAAGAAWFNTNNGEVYYQKSPTSSVALAPKLLKKYFNKATTWMMMHTRYATHGKNTADNAHPHFGPKAHVTLVHNGVVHNYDTVWEALDAKQTGPVDSQAVAACLEAGGIEKVVELCEGSMSLIWSDARDPAGTLKFWTNGGNPLHAGRLDSETGIIVVGSTEKHLHDAFGKRLFNDWACAIGKEYTISPDGVITSRHIEGSADTAGISYDWRTYAQWNRTPVKATGDSDTCAIDIGSVNVASIQLMQYDWEDMNLNDAIDNAYNEMLGANWNSKKAMYYQSWPADAPYHGFDGQSHMGIRPDGTKYDLPLRWADGKDCSPDICSDTMAMVLAGHFDPDQDDQLVKYEMVDDFDMEWHDIIAGNNGEWYDWS